MRYAMHEVSVWVQYSMYLVQYKYKYLVHVYYYCTVPGIFDPLDHLSVTTPSVHRVVFVICGTCTSTCTF